MKRNRFGAIALAFLLSINITSVSAKVTENGVEQNYNPLQTAIPSLSISPDAVGGGKGDVGAATAPDCNSQHWNPAKYALSESKGGVAISYVPWLRKIVDDIYLVYLAGYYKPTERTAIGA